jgi:hypothetical protein
MISDNLDLHSFPVPMEAQPNAVAKLKGTLVNSETKKPFKGIVSVIDLDKVSRSHQNFSGRWII